MKLKLLRRLDSERESNKFCYYVSWTYTSETIYFGRWELSIHHRRK